MDDQPNVKQWSAASVELVTIPLHHYTELLSVWSAANKARIAKDRLKPLPRSRLERNPEVASFLAARFGKMELHEIITAAKAQFGKDAVPSLSAVHRYWQRLRAEAGLISA